MRVEQNDSIISYESIAKGVDKHGEYMWATNRHGSDDRIPKSKFPNIEDPKFEGGIHPQFIEEV